MKPKTLLTTFCLIIIWSGKMFCQENRQTFLEGYRGKEYVFFDSVNKLNRKRLEALSHSYDFYITFKIDTSGKIIYFDLIEIPGIKIPPLAEAYIKDLLALSEGKWVGEIKNQKKVVSDEITFKVGLVKADQSISERAKDNEPAIEYLFGSGEKMNEKIKRFELSDSKKIITLVY